MNDHEEFMKSLHRDPDETFARGLREKLHAQGSPRAYPRVRPMPALAFGVAAAVVVALFAFPSMRVSAQAMLDYFRVRKFAAVQFDAQRLEKLKAMKDTPQMDVFDRQQLQAPAPPQHFTSLAPAAAAAGLPAMRASYLPSGLVADTVTVEGEGAARLVVNEPRLRALLQTLNVTDVDLPAGIDGKAIEVKNPRVLVQTFKNGTRHAALVEAESPQVSVPAGLDVEKLGEIGLRILGLDAAEARRVSMATDWRSTLVVPVPISASTFRQITVHGQPGLLITTNGEPEGNRAGHRNGTTCLWTENDRVFGLMGNLAPDDVLQMAESVR